LVHLSLTTCTYTQFKKEIIYLLEAYLSKKWGQLVLSHVVSRCQ
jgi:hypothetical protein